MKRMRLPAVLLAACLMTACSHTNVPPADYDDSQPEIVTQPLPSGSETESASPTEVTTVQTATSAEAAGIDDETADLSDTDASEEDTEETAAETGLSRADAWADSYEKLLWKKNLASEHVDAYYALIRLNADKIPELVILDDIYMEVYYYTDGKAELLMEDAYKSSAVSEQNVCYQPIVGKLASAFSTMGGGSGFNIFVYEKLDTVHVQRFCFDNNEDEGGEMPYNTLWDKAEEFGVVNNGWNDVTLSDPWIHIGEDFEDLHELTDAGAQTLLADWDHILYGDDPEEDA